MGNITLKDIAKKAGVSEATVSLVLNNKSVVNSRTRGAGTEVHRGDEL